MLTSVFTKAIRDRWIGLTIATSSLVAWFMMAMAMYRDIDLSIYTDLPEGFRELMGVPEGADAASLSYNVVLGFAGALTLAGMAVSIGSAGIAGEERNGTLGLLLANPKTRTHVLFSKAASIPLLIGAATAVLWGAGRLIPLILGVEIGGTHVGAMHVHLGVNSVFYGFMAMAIGAWTGNRSVASGVTAAVMVLSYFAVGLLPLVDGLANGAKAFPWYYFSSSDPLVNGISWSHLAVLVSGTVVMAVAAFVGVNRRDLRDRTVGVTLLDRLRAYPTTQRVFDRLAGSTRVSRLWIKTTSDHQGLLIITAAVMFGFMGVLLGPMYAAIDESLASLSDSFPEEVLAIAGGGDMTTPEGFYQIESFSLMAPIAVMIMTILVGARALAGDDARHTLGLLLASPIRRSAVVLEQAFAMVVCALVVGVATFAGVAGGSLIAGLGMSFAGMAAGSVLVTLLGLLFGALALLLGAATGSAKIATYGAIGAALTSHLLNSFLPLSDDLGRFARWTPNYYYLSSEPLLNGMPWGHAAVLAGLTVACVGTAIVLFERRDLK